MVARNGMPKAPANSMNFTLIADDFSIHTMSGNKLAAAINDKKVVVTNMSVSNKGLVSTNGALDKYTLIDTTGNIVGVPRNVILNRIEVNNKLAGYVMFTAAGVISKISVAEAATLANNGLIANGKVRHTADGDIVAAIGGNYPLIETKIEDVKTEKPVVDLVFFGSAIDKDKMCKFAGVTITSKSAATFAKKYSLLKSENEQLIKGLRDDLGYTEDELKSFEIKQAPGAGFYGVYRLAAVISLMASASKVKCSISKLMIGCKDRSVEDCDESIVIYDIKKKSIVNSQEGTEESDAKLKKYAAEVIKKLQ